MTGTFANEDVMEEYLLALLTEDEPVQEAAPVKTEVKPKEDKVQKQSVARLLKDVSPVAKKALEPVIETSPPVVDVPLPPPVIGVSSPKPAVGVSLPKPAVGVSLPKPAVGTVPEVAPPETQTQPETSAGGGDGAVVEDSRVIEGNFQSLFFNVAGLTLAVPLTELGGIHNLEKPGPLFGKPAWFMGVMLHREEKLNVVDTAKWVMPEKCNEILEDSLKYQYLIMLGDSGWGLACEELVNTVTLQTNDVKWRDMDGRRPWLAGMVKEKMCAMLDVKQLIKMLNKGLNSNQQQ